MKHTLAYDERACSVASIGTVLSSNVLWCAGRELLQSKTVTATAQATPSLSVLVEALTAANLTGAAPCHAPLHVLATYRLVT